MIDKLSIKGFSTVEECLNGFLYVKDDMEDDYFIVSYSENEPSIVVISFIIGAQTVAYYLVNVFGMNQEEFSAIVEKYKDECYEKYSRS